jgi:hypothetical protein
MIEVFDILMSKGVFPTELTSDEEMERNLSEWRRMNGLCECDGKEFMYDKISI